jgi:ribose transport system ATP-binding protein
VLIMDEPTAALNAQEVADLFRVIRQLRADGVGIVYISHRMDELQQIADRVTVMRDGRTIDTVADAGDTSLEAVIHMMVGRALEENLRGTPPDTSPARSRSRCATCSAAAAIRDVSFSVRKGEILGFAGLMGAGRTEVARAVFGADPVDGGEILVHGRAVRIRSPRDAVAHGIGYLSEDRKQFGLATAMDVQANIAMTSLSRLLRLGVFIDAAAIADTAEGYVRQLGIRTPSVAQPVKLLSGGNQQKVVIAKWLLRDCDILFFDEPTRGIDVGAKAEIHKLIDALAAAGQGDRRDLVRAAGDPAPVAPRDRDVRRPRHRRAGAREATQESIMQLATRRAPAARIH